MTRFTRARTLALTLAMAASATTLAALPVAPASAQPCNVDLSCSNGVPRRPPDGGDLPVVQWKTGWITYVDSDGLGSYSRWGTYRVNQWGNCYDTNDVGVGCP